MGILTKPGKHIHEMWMHFTDVKFEWMLQK